MQVSLEIKINFLREYFPLNEKHVKIEKVTRCAL